MSTAYKLIINEYKQLYNDLSNDTSNSSKIIIKEFNYKISILDIDRLYKCIINFIYEGKAHVINIYYNKYYPHEPPKNININNINIQNIYNDIINKNKILFFNRCLYRESNLCLENWNISCNIKYILKEVIKVINYKNLHIEIRLLNSVINKYSPNENLDYLYYYLL